jgi:hypothetical protein
MSFQVHDSNSDEVRVAPVYEVEDQAPSGVFFSGFRPSKRPLVAKGTTLVESCGPRIVPCGCDRDQPYPFMTRENWAEGKGKLFGPDGVENILDCQVGAAGGTFG